MLACYLLAFKLTFGLNDAKTNDFGTFGQYLAQIVPKLEALDQEKYLWRLKDVSKVRDIK